MLRKVNLVVILLAVMLAICAARRLTTGRAQTEVHPIEGACCGKKPPKFPDLKATTTTAAQTYSTFTGQMAIVTGQLRGGSSVIAVDLKNENAGVPVNTNWAAPTYQHPDWLTIKMGDVFGSTLDSRGDVFVTATTSYFIKAPVTSANPGKIYRIDGTTGLVNTFATLPNNVNGPALGNIHYSCVKQSYYVSNFGDGRIYQITKSTAASPTGNVVATFDHQTGTIVTGGSAGTQEAGTNYSNFVPKNTPGVARGGRVWGLAVLKDKLFYGTWRQDTGEHAPPDNMPNEVWSIGLLPNGNFTGTPTLEITLPTLQFTNPTGGAKTFSNPVSSIAFTAAGNMLLAERTMNGDRNNKNGNYAAHASRYLEYTKVGPSWTLLFPTQFGPGTLTSSGQPSSAGGVAPDPSGMRDWGTADAMQLGPQILYGIQGIPMGGGNVASSLLVDLTDSTTTYDKNQMGDIEIPCPDCGAAPTPSPSPAECCDKLAAVPHPQQNVSLDYRTFTITNLKAPQSPICSVDISMNPTPNPIWQGGDLYINGVLVPTATRFISPYTRIPNKPPASTISATNTVQFNLGIDYTIGWTGTVTFVVHHCDGSICTLSYGPWSALPPTTVPGTSVFDANVIQEGKLYTIGLQLKQRDIRKPINWIGFTVGDEKGQIFAASAPPIREARGRNFTEAILENSGLSQSSVLYTFGEALKSGASSSFSLVVRRDAATDAPLVRFTTYDANGNALETGTISGAAPR